MVWQKIDDQFGVSKKVLKLPRREVRAPLRLACVGLWTLATNQSARLLSDGVIEAHELEELGATPTVVDELIRVGMFHGNGHDCDRCVPVPAGDIVIHDVLHYNPSRDEVLEARAADAARKKKSREDRKQNPAGVQPDAGRNPTSAGAESSHPDPDPVPDPSTKTDPSSHVLHRESSPQDDQTDVKKSVDWVVVETNLARYTKREVARFHAQFVVGTLSARTHDFAGIKDVNRYIAVAIRDDWAVWQKFVDENPADRLAS